MSEKEVNGNAKTPLTLFIIKIYKYNKNYLNNVKIV